MGAKPGKLGFTLMTLIFKLRDYLSPPEKKLIEAGLTEGFTVLDYGCGPGSYAVAAAAMVGPSGTVYAADISPHAIAKIQAKAQKANLSNIRTIQTECDTGLADESVDVALLFDIFHALESPDRILDELYRVIKPYGLLSFSDHHMKEVAIKSQVTQSGRFRLSHQGIKTYTFVKAR